MKRHKFVETAFRPFHEIVSLFKDLGSELGFSFQCLRFGSCAFEDALNSVPAFLADVNVPVLSPLANCHSLLLSGLPPLQEQRDSNTHTWSIDLVISIVFVLVNAPVRSRQ